MNNRIQKVRQRNETRPSALTAEQVEQEFGIPVGTLRYWRHCDAGPRSYTVGRRIRYDRADLESWLKLQKLNSARGGVA